MAHNFCFVFFYVVLVFDDWLNDLWVTGNDMYLIMTIREKDEYTLDLAIKKGACDFFYKDLGCYKTEKEEWTQMSNRRRVHLRQKNKL